MPGGIAYKSVAFEIKARADDGWSFSGYASTFGNIDQGGDVTSSVAAAMTLGDGATGYLVVAIFPGGGWDDERADFERIVRSFRTDVPPGLETFPVDGQAS